MEQTTLHKSILFIIIVFLGLDLQGQSYHPMPGSDAKWDITRCWSFYPGGWHDEYSIRLDGSDTTINGHVYKKLDLVTHHLPGTQFDSVYSNFLGGMREFNKQVFFISEYLCIDTIERMVYDFNDAGTGDTIFTQILTNGLTQFIPHIVTAIDSVWVEASYRRRIHLRDENNIFYESWIEGIGSSLGLTYASYWLLTDNSYDLNCFYDENELKYTNTTPEYLFCLFPLPDIQCDSVTTSIAPVPTAEDIRIYPNPVADFMNIESVHFASLEIFNTCGERVLASGFTPLIQLDFLSPGIYFLRLNEINGQMPAILKFIKM